MADESKEVQQAIVGVAQIHQHMTALNKRLNITFKTQKERDAEKLLNEMKQASPVKHRIDLLIPKETENVNNTNAARMHEEKLKNKPAPEPVVIQAEHLSLSDQLHREMTAKNAPANLPPVAQSGGSTDSGGGNASPAATSAPAANTAAAAPTWNDGKAARKKKG